VSSCEIVIVAAWCWSGRHIPVPCSSSAPHPPPPAGSSGTPGPPHEVSHPHVHLQGGARGRASHAGKQPTNEQQAQVEHNTAEVSEVSLPVQLRSRIQTSMTASMARREQVPLCEQTGAAGVLSHPMKCLRSTVETVHVYGTLQLSCPHPASLNTRRCTPCCSCSRSSVGMMRLHMTFVTTVDLPVDSVPPLD
jgi:hypothetical protein